MRTFAITYETKTRYVGSHTLLDLYVSLHAMEGPQTTPYIIGGVTYTWHVTEGKASFLSDVNLHHGYKGNNLERSLAFHKWLKVTDKPSDLLNKFADIATKERESLDEQQEYHATYVPKRVTDKKSVRIVQESCI